MQERSLFLVRFEAKPLPESGADASGAFVNVWVDAPTAAGAKDIAVSEICGAGWAVEGQIEVGQISRSDYEKDATGLGYFEQALVDGVVLVLHTWHELH